jgi:hypothetical protein
MIPYDFEAIDTSRRKPIHPLIVIQGKHIMADWVSPKMELDSTINMSDKGFTTDEIAIQFLYHFNRYTGQGARSE